MIRRLALSILLAVYGCAQRPAAPARARPQKHPQSKTRPLAPDVTTLRAPQVDTELIQKLKGKNLVVVDVRDPNDFVNGHLAGARNIDFLQADFETRVAKLDPKKTYLLYCSSGSRAGKALLYFQARGLKAENIGGFTDLRERGASVEGISTAAP